MTRLELLERVNELNVDAVRQNADTKYWTVKVLYNDVVYKCERGKTSIHEIARMER